MLRAFVFLLLVNLALAATQFFLPNIKIVNPAGLGYKLQSQDNVYSLTINNKDGFLREIVREDEDSPGALLVDGLYGQKFDDKYQLLLNYLAGADGNVVRYKFQRIEPSKPTITPKPTKTPHNHILLRTECLKACVG